MSPLRLLSAAMALRLAGLAAPSTAWGQEPVFTTPPVTMYQRGIVAGLTLETVRGGYKTSLEGAFGVWPPLTLALGALGTREPGGSLELARVHVGARLRLIKIDRPAEWILVSVYGLGALPVGESVDRVAVSRGVPDAALGLSAARMARRGDIFADLSAARIPTDTRDRWIGTAGFAVGWRPAPRGYGHAEIQLFAEARARYSEGGTASLGVAPGALVHTRNALLKVGVLLPAWERKTSEWPVVLLGVRLVR